MLTPLVNTSQISKNQISVLIDSCLAPIKHNNRLFKFAKLHCRQSAPRKKEQWGLKPITSF